MPTCKKCSKPFPNHLYQDGKRHFLGNRKYCLDCSPFGEGNNRKLENIFLNSEGERFCICQICNRQYSYMGKKHCNNLNKCDSCCNIQRRISIKKRCVEYKGNKCIRCGYCKCLRCLEFHHRNPNEKSFTISQQLTTSWERLRIELDKCDLLCANCHGETEEELFKLECSK